MKRKQDTSSKHNLSQIKDKTKYVGMGCVYWPRDLSRKPISCQIIGYTQTSRYTDSGHIVQQSFKIRAEDPGSSLRQPKKCIVDTLVAQRQDLWQNFTDLYQWILKETPFSDLADLKSYAPILGVKSQVSSIIDQIRADCDWLKLSLVRCVDYDQLQEFKRSLLEKTRCIQNLVQKNDFFDINFLREKTCYGFIQTMSKKLPDLKCSGKSLQTLFENKD